MLSQHRVLQPLGNHSGVDVCSHWSACRLFLMGFWSLPLRSSALAYLIIPQHKRGRNEKMSAKKARTSKQQPIHLKINLVHQPSSPAASPHFSLFPPRGSERIKSLKGEGTWTWIHCKKGPDCWNKKIWEYPEIKKKIHYLYENTAMREYLKRRLRTSSDDLAINRRTEKNWLLQKFQSPGRKSLGLTKEAEVKKKKKN